MISSRNLETLELTPTSAYFFAQLNHIYDEAGLLKCKKAAQEYVRTPGFNPTTPCDEYFRSITTAIGCILLDDQLSEVEEAPVAHGFMAGNHMAKYYQEMAESYIQAYKIPALSEPDLLAILTIGHWRDKIDGCIKIYLERREAKFNQFSDHIIKYISDGTLPKNRDENGLVYTFNNLDPDEQKQLVQKINEKFPATTTIESFLYQVASLFAPDQAYDGKIIEERAKQFTSSVNGNYDGVRLHR